MLSACTHYALYAVPTYVMVSRSVEELSATGLGLGLCCPRVPGPADGERRIILRSLVLTHCQCVADKQPVAMSRSDIAERHINKLEGHSVVGRSHLPPTKVWSSDGSVNKKLCCRKEAARCFVSV